MNSAPEAQRAPACAICGAAYTPRTRLQITCGAEKCQSVRGYRRNRENPAYVQATRERFARWRAAHCPDHTPQPWLAGAPPYAPTLPGASCSLTLDPLPKWPLELRHGRILHGALHHALGVGHAGIAEWTLYPYASGWALHWLTEGGANLCGGALEIDLFHQRRMLRFGPPVAIKAPVIQRRGRHRVRVDTITPVVIRAGHPDHGMRTHRTEPTANNVSSSLAHALPARLGLAPLHDRVCVELVERCTEPVTIDRMGKYGLGGNRGVRGFTGYMVLDVNAVARWLLECAARGIGLGGYVAHGFGRVRVSEVL